MRKLLILTLALCATLTAGWGQQSSVQKTGRRELLEQLHSDNAQVRSDALEQLRSDPAALRDPNVKAALVSQLARENHESLSEDDEGYAEYKDWLTETVVKVVNWNDSGQVCILANSQSLPGELADHAGVAVPCLLQRFKNGSPVSRDAVAVMLVQISAKKNNGLDAATTKTVRQVILDALQDPDSFVRGDIVRALGKFGGEDMIPALEEVSKTDTSVDELKHNFWIREYAVKAIAAIQARAGQH